MFSSVCVYMYACMCLYICGAQRSPVDTIPWELPLLLFELGLSLELEAHLFSYVVWPLIHWSLSTLPASMPMLRL